MRLENFADVDLGDPDVAVCIALDVLKLGEVLGVEVEDQALGDDRDAVASAVTEALEDGADQRVDDCPQLDLASGEFLGDEGERRAGGLAHPEGQVPGLAAHRDHEVPARRGLGVDHQVLHDLDAVVTRGLEAEGVDVRRQVEVVVDRLRHVRDVDPAARLLFELHRGEGRVVAADGDEHRDVQSQQRDDGRLEELRVLRGIGPGDADVRAAAEVDPADLIDLEGEDRGRCCPS